jgi:hypothetical protein
VITMRRGKGMIGDFRTRLAVPFDSPGCVLLYANNRRRNNLTTDGSRDQVIIVR